MEISDMMQTMLDSRILMTFRAKSPQVHPLAYQVIAA